MKGFNKSQSCSVVTCVGGLESAQPTTLRQKSTLLTSDILLSHKSIDAVRNFLEWSINILIGSTKFTLQLTGNRDA